MGISEHVREFAGYPVEVYDPAKGIYRKPVEASSTLGALAGALRANPDERVSRMALMDYLSEQGEQASPVAYRVSGEGSVKPLTAFLNDPFTVLVQALVVGCCWEGYEGSGAVVQALENARDRLPNLRALFLGDVTWDEQEISWLRLCDLSGLLAAFPQLEHFRSRGGEGMVLQAFEQVNLRSLTFESSGLPREVVRAVGASTLPNLEHLELWLGTDEYGANTEVGDLAGILEGSGLPAVRSLGLRNSDITDDVAEALAGSPLLERLKVLDLSLGTLGDRGARALLASPAVANLERLNIHHHYVSPELVEQLRGLGIEVDAGDEQEMEDPDDPEANRYVAHSE